MKNKENNYSKNNNIKTTNVYDDDDIPPVDLKNLVPGEQEADTRPRQDGPGGN